MFIILEIFFLQCRILGDLFSKLLNFKEILSALKILLVCSKCLVLFILTIYWNKSLMCERKSQSLKIGEYHLGNII